MLIIYLSMQLSHYKTLYNSEKNHWWYKVRRELIHILIKKYMGNPKNIYILDVGCGTGALMKELEVYGNVYGIDFSDQAVDFCKSRGIVNVQKSVVEKIPYQDKYFDLVLALDVLEHIPDDKSGIKEIYRVLKPGGTVIIFVPTFMFLWGVTDVISQHYRRYTKIELFSKVKDGGFNVLYSSYFNFFLFIPIAIARYFVNIFKIKIKSENDTGDGFVNKILYKVFSLEIPLIKYFSLPFGVSGMVVVKK